MGIRDVIWVDPDRLGGKPCFRGTRIPVSILIEYLEAGHSVDDFLRAYPDLSAEMVKAYIRLAHESIVASVA